MGSDDGRWCYIVSHWLSLYFTQNDPWYDGCWVFWCSYLRIFGFHHKESQVLFCLPQFSVFHHDYYIIFICMIVYIFMPFFIFHSFILHLSYLLMLIFSSSYNSFVSQLATENSSILIRYWSLIFHPFNLVFEVCFHYWHPFDELFHGNTQYWWKIPTHCGLVTRYRICRTSLRVKFMGPTWSPPGAARNQVGPMLATWTLLSGFPSLF